MENYIFNCYQKWLKDEKGNIFQQFLKCNRVVKILIILLFIPLIVMMASCVFLFNTKSELWTIILAIATLAELGASILAYVYNNRYDIDNSSNDLKHHREHCDELKEMLTKHHVSHSLMIKIADRYKAAIDDIETKMKSNYERINKVMQIVLIPLSAAILGELIKEQDADSVLNYGVLCLFIIGIIYGILFLPIFLYNNVLSDIQSKYRRFVNDLQSVLDFEECDARLEETV